jgi:hypothetical protein
VPQLLSRLRAASLSALVLLATVAVVLPASEALATAPQGSLTSSVTATEGTLKATLTLKLYTKLNASSTLKWWTFATTGNATPLVDFPVVNASSPTVVTVPANTETVTFDVPIYDDTIDEPSQKFWVDAKPGDSSYTLINSETTVSIVDDDAPAAITVGDSVATTEGGTLTYQTCSAASEVAYAVIFTTTNDGTASVGSDFSYREQVLHLDNAGRCRSVQVPSIQDSRDEEAETVLASIRPGDTAPLNITDSSGSGTLNDDDAEPAATVGSASAAEGSPLTFQVFLTPASGKTVTVDYATSPGSATIADFTSKSGSLTIPKDVGFANILVPTTDDAVDEGDETVLLTISNPTSATLGAPSSQVGTIQDGDPMPTVSVEAASVTEGDQATVTVRVAGLSQSPTRASYGTSDGTATSSDYTAASGTVDFSSGDLLETFTIQTTQDDLIEATETLKVDLSALVGLQPGAMTANVSILDDEAEAPAVSISDVSVSEGNAGTTTATLTVSLAAPATGSFAVSYLTEGSSATSGTDFAPASGVLTFVSGDTSKPIDVTVNGDTTIEANEVFRVVISSPVAPIADAVGLGTIVNDDVPTVSVGDATVSENVSGGKAVFTITLSAASPETTGVAFQTSPGSAVSPADFASRSNVLFFAAGETVKTVAVSVVNDGLEESTETFTLGLHTPSRLVILDPTGVGTILDDDAARISINDPAAAVETGSASFTVSIDHTTAAPVTVDYAVESGSAMVGVDLLDVSGSVTIPIGQTVAPPIVVSFIDNGQAEAREDFYVNLSNPSGAVLADGRGRGQIIDDDGVAVSVSAAVDNEGDALCFGIRTSDGQAHPGATVQFATAQSEPGVYPNATAGSDYDVTVGTVGFTAGNTVSACVPTTGDALVEGNEVVDVVLFDPQNGVGIDVDRATGVILDDDRPSISVGDVSVSEGDNGTTIANLPVTLDQPGMQTVGAGVNMLVAGSTAGTEDFTSETLGVEFAPGETSKTVPVQITGDIRPEPDETIAVSVFATLGDPVADADGLVNILDDDVPAISVADASVAEGDGQLVFDVTVPYAGLTPFTVDYATAGGTALAAADYTAATGTLTFAPGDLQKSIVVPIADDGRDEPDEDLTVALTNPGGATLADATATGSILDDDLPEVSILDGSVPEAGIATVTLSLSSPTFADVHLPVAFSDGTATGPADFGSGGTIAFIPAGMTTGSANTSLVHDTLDEDDETIVATITGTDPSVQVLDDTAVGTIVDDDVTPPLSIDDDTAEEGTYATLTVSRSTEVGRSSTVHYATEDGSATAGSDYTAQAGDLTFAPGDITKTIQVPILADPTRESVETLSVVLTDPVKTEILDGTGVISIDPDTSDLPLLSVNDVSVAEGNGGTRVLQFTVTLEPASTFSVTADFATAGGTATEGDDYAAAAGSLVFAPGETSKIVDVAVLGDTLEDAAAETMTLNLSNLVEAASDDLTGVGTILEDDPYVNGLLCTLVGTSRPDNLVGGKRTADVICGMGGNDALTGLGGDDALFGGDGNDVMAGGTGNDVMDGGPGSDTATFGDSGVAGSVIVDLPAGEANNAVLGSDTLLGVESADTGPGDDLLIGDAGRNVLNGKGGGDEIHGGDGIDTIQGGPGDDELYGDGFDDTILPGSGADVADGGGNGFFGDTVRYSELTVAVSVDLAGSAGGEGGVDTLSGFENALGGAGNDVLTAVNFPGPNRLQGAGGDDQISVIDGIGNDFADGGAGTDVCATDPGDVRASCES